MSELQNYLSKREPYVPLKLKLHVWLFSEDEKFIDFVKQSLDRDTYRVKVVASQESSIALIQNQKEKIDCLILTNTASSRQIIPQLKQAAIFLPTAIAFLENDFVRERIVLYHPAEVKFEFDSQPISDRLSLALSQFLSLDEGKCKVETRREQVDIEHYHSLSQQQRRLAEKLKERLGYLGVYYKRNPQDFYRNLTDSQKTQLNRQLAVEYRKIVLGYFENEPKINQTIDRFVNAAFFSNISVSQVLEIHMELMDEFAQQLKIEGRSEDILLDYRLTLIDIIAHLCEMYRRSIPGSDGLTMPFALE